MRNILVATGSESERHLVAPIIQRLYGISDVRCSVLLISPREGLSRIVDLTNRTLKRVKPDIFVVPCDRREMVPAAMMGFYSNVVTVHFLGGMDSYGGVWDDAGRHAIDNLSHIHLVESELAKKNLFRKGEEDWRITVVGTTHFDDVVPDLALVPKWEFDIFAMNPVTVSATQTRTEVRRGLKELDKATFFIGPNEDQNANIVNSEIRKFLKTSTLGEKWSNKSAYCPRHRLYQRVPRARFLGLLSHAERFISNSSAIHYEAPYYKKKVINPSIRNSWRDPMDPQMMKGGADRAVSALLTLDLNDERLLMKRIG